MESSGLGKLDIPRLRFERRQQHAILDRNDIILELLLRQVLPLEPIRQHQFPTGSQELVGILKEESLVGEMRERLRDPDDVECAKFILRPEKVAHFFSVERNEFHRSASRAEGESTVRSGRGVSTGIFPTEVVGDFHLLVTNGDARGFPPKVLGEVPSRSTDTTSNVEDLQFLRWLCVFPSETSAGEQELDERYLGIFF